MLDKLLAGFAERYGDTELGPGSKKRGDEFASWRGDCETVRPRCLWLLGPGARSAFPCSFDPCD